MAPFPIKMFVIFIVNADLVNTVRTPATFLSLGVLLLLLSNNCLLVVYCKWQYQWKPRLLVIIIRSDSIVVPIAIIIYSR